LLRWRLSVHLPGDISSMGSEVKTGEAQSGDWDGAALGRGDGQGLHLADKRGGGVFVKDYEETSRLEKETDNKMILVVGNRQWPFPIPIVKKGETWVFDTKAGKEELLNRGDTWTDLHPHTAASLPGSQPCYYRWTALPSHLPTTR
jgi:hypothetical protein